MWTSVDSNGGEAVQDEVDGGIRDRMRDMMNEGETGRSERRRERRNERRREKKRELMNDDEVRVWKIERR